MCDQDDHNRFFFLSQTPKQTISTANSTYTHEVQLSVILQEHLNIYSGDLGR